MVTVIISTINDSYLEKTVENVRQNAGGEVEFIVVNDGGSPVNVPNATVINHFKIMGRRFSINQAARIAQGNYLFVLDSHCSMSKDWDIKMKESVRDNNLVYSVIRDMHPQTWQYLPGDYLHVSLNDKYTEKWWNRKKLADCEIEEESIALTGCAWMVTRERYWQLGGYDEVLGEYGWDGPEWALKIWMNEGKVILRTDVICGHIFGTNDSGKLYKCKMIPESQYVEYMDKKYGNRIKELFCLFPDAPNWTEKKGKLQKTKREVKIERQVEHVTTDNKTQQVIKKVIEHYEFVYTDDDNGPTEEELIKMYDDKLELVSTEVWEYKDGELQKVA